jgi:hypothetical protein
MRERRERAESNTHKQIRDRKQLGILLLSFLDLNYLFMIQGSELFEPEVRISVYTLDVSV